MKVGTFYKSEGGTIVLCTKLPNSKSEFHGVVVKKGKNDTSANYIGEYCKYWTTLGTWKKVKIKINKK